MQQNFQPQGYPQQQQGYPQQQPGCMAGMVAQQMAGMMSGHQGMPPQYSPQGMMPQYPSAQQGCPMVANPLHGSIFAIQSFNFPDHLVKIEGIKICNSKILLLIHFYIIYYTHAYNTCFR